MKIKILGAHNTESRDTRVGGILIDGVVALDCGALTSTLTFEEQLSLRAVLVTHHHFDHIKDVVLLGATFYHAKARLGVYCPEAVADALHYLFSYPGKLYTDFLRRPTGSPTIDLHTVQPLVPFSVEGYQAIAVPVKHSAPAVGFQLTALGGRKLFYTGDTGVGLEDCWRQISPDLLIIECTASNRYINEGRESGHLTPALLRDELISFWRIHGYLPRVATTHHFPDPAEYEEIVAELKGISAELDVAILPAHEGLELEI